MPNVVLTENETYHIFNRGLDRRPVFLNHWDFVRAWKTLDFYRFKNTSLNLAKVLVMGKEDKEKFFSNLRKDSNKQVEVISYCFMPNHFHFLLKQKQKEGISTFLSNFTNSYTRYFNARHKRRGRLFEGVFKAVRIETEEQLMHVSRYFHLNPVVSLVIKECELGDYNWSSFPEYLGECQGIEICDKEIVLSGFSSKEDYRTFVHDRIEYGQKLESIKHLLLEVK